MGKDAPSITKCTIFDSNGVEIEEKALTSKGNNLWFCDIVFPDDAYCLVKAFKNTFLYKIGTPDEDLIFLQGTEKTISIFDESGTFIKDKNLETVSLVDNLYKSNFSSDAELGNGNYLVYYKGDFKKIKIPQVIEQASITKDGKILIQPGFNLIAWQGNANTSWLNRNTNEKATVYNCIYQQLLEKYGEGAWRGCRTYDEKNGKFLDYIPGLTPESAEGNFNLIENDSGNYEIQGIEFFSLYPSEMELEFY